MTCEHARAPGNSLTQIFAEIQFIENRCWIHKISRSVYYKFLSSSWLETSDPWIYRTCGYMLIPIVSIQYTWCVCVWCCSSRWHAVDEHSRFLPEFDRTIRWTIEIWFDVVVGAHHCVIQLVCHCIRYIVVGAIQVSLYRASEALKYLVESTQLKCKTAIDIYQDRSATVS